MTTSVSRSRMIDPVGRRRAPSTLESLHELHTVNSPEGVPPVGRPTKYSGYTRKCWSTSPHPDATEPASSEVPGLRLRHCGECAAFRQKFAKIPLKAAHSSQCVAHDYHGESVFTHTPARDAAPPARQPATGALPSRSAPRGPPVHRVSNWLPRSGLAFDRSMRGERRRRVVG